MPDERHVEAADLALIAFGAGWGLTWALASIFVWSEWWNGESSSLIESLVRAILLWPLAVTVLMGRGWPVDPFVLVVGIGVFVGLVCGAVAAIWLHRALD